MAQPQKQSCEVLKTEALTHSRASMCPATNPHSDGAQACAGRTVLPPSHRGAEQLLSSDVIAHDVAVCHTA